MYKPVQTPKAILTPGASGDRALSVRRSGRRQWMQKNNLIQALVLWFMISLLTLSLTFAPDMSDSRPAGWIWPTGAFLLAPWDDFLNGPLLNYIKLILFLLCLVFLSFFFSNFTSFFFFLRISHSLSFFMLSLCIIFVTFLIFVFFSHILCLSVRKRTEK